MLLLLPCTGCYMIGAALMHISCYTDPCGAAAAVVIACGSASRCSCCWW
jgi:hypothetical protein